jgi:hypothetical protein
MPHLGDRELVRVFAKHEPYTDGHLGKVVAEMKERGAPIINVVEWRGDYYATEGSHRLAAAYHLELMPVLIVCVPDNIDQDDEAFWQKVKGTLPHYSWLRPVTSGRTADTTRQPLSGP